MVWYGMEWYAMLCYAMLCYAMLWYGMETMVYYEISMQCYDISMLCYGMVYFVKDKHSATVRASVSKGRSCCFYEVFFPYYYIFYCFCSGDFSKTPPSIFMKFSHQIPFILFCLDDVTSGFEISTIL